MSALMVCVRIRGDEAGCHGKDAVDHHYYCHHWGPHPHVHGANKNVADVLDPSENMHLCG